MSRIGRPIQIVSGRLFWPMAPRVEDIHIADIAHALARICRFGGHVNGPPYSVAQHSVHVSRLAGANGAQHALAGLLHDATEAYVGDLVRPLKAELPMFEDAEARIATVIEGRFGLPPGAFADSHIRWCDDTLLATEFRDLMGGQTCGSQLQACEHLDERIEAWGWEVAEQLFLERFEELTK